MKTTLTAVALGVVSLAFFLWHISIPPERVFDEGIFIPAANALLAHAPNPNPQSPPIGKFMIAVGIKAFGDNPRGWRIPSAVFGSLTLVGVFLWANLLLDSYSLALTAAFLTLLNNFLFIFSRTAMMDIYMVSFLIWGLLAFTAATMLDHLSVARRRGLFLSSGIMFGFACASKWNGIDTLGIAIAACVLLLWLSPRRANPEIARLAGHLRHVGVPWIATSLLLVPIVAYAITFIPFLQPLSLREFVSTNAYIWQYHRAQIGNVFLASPWYQWPLKFQPLRALSYLVGNWYVMWAGVAALLVCARRFGRSAPETLLIALYAGNLSQWALTPQHCLFYYYYFPAAILLGVAIPLALRQMPERIWGVRLSILCVLPAVVVFAYCFPRMAHLPQPWDCALGCWP
jgi:4-amino-4-deoxy-L-arabinose transferase-like glycosyltransferase